MKLTLIALAACFSLSSFAGGYLHPKTVTCEELTDMLETQGSVAIVYGLLGVSRGTAYNDERDVGPCANGIVRALKVRTSDGSCDAGYICVTQSPRRM